MKKFLLMLFALFLFYGDAYFMPKKLYPFDRDTIKATEEMVRQNIEEGKKHLRRCYEVIRMSLEHDRVSADIMRMRNAKHLFERKFSMAKKSVLLEKKEVRQIKKDEEWFRLEEEVERRRKEEESFMLYLALEETKEKQKSL